MSKQARIVSTNSFASHAFTPSIDHPWLTYGMELNGKPVPVTDF